MKIKLGELRTIIEGMQDIVEKTMPAVFSYWVKKTLPILVKEFQDAEKSRNDLCVKHCNKNQEGKPEVKKDEMGNDIYDIPDMVAFNKELSELMNEEIEIKFTPITINELKNVDISPITLIKLDKFILEEE